MNFQIVDFLPPNWVHALCITLFHSLWMGMGLAVVTSLIIVSTRKSSAALRYNLLTTGLFLYVLGIIVVFYTALTPVDGTQNGIAVQNVVYQAQIHAKGSYP